MAIRNFAKYLTLALLVVSCQIQELQNPQAPENTGPAASIVENATVVPGVVSVQFNDELTARIEAELTEGQAVPTKAFGAPSLLEELGIESMERVFPDGGEFEARRRSMGMHRFYKVHFKGETPVTKAVQSFESIPGVVTAHPVRTVHKRGFTTPNDPRYSYQWHYYNSQGNDINVRDVWNNYTTGSDKVIVCVVDEPIDPTHQDLADNIWKDEQGHTGYNFARNSWNTRRRYGWRREQ